MNKKVLVYLCNNKDFLNMYCKKITKEKIDSEFHIIVNERNQHLIHEFEIIVENYVLPFNDIKIYHDGDILVSFKKCLSDRAKLFVDEYELAIKIILPWYILGIKEYSQMIFMDDDTILFKNPFNFIDDTKVFASMNWVDNIYCDKKRTKNNTLDINGLLDCFDPERNVKFEDVVKFVSSNRTDAGIWGLNQKFYNKVYKNGLINFFEHEFFQHITLNNRKNSFLKYINSNKNKDNKHKRSRDRIRKFDQNFISISLYFYKDNVNYIKENKDLLHLLNYNYPKWLEANNNKPVKPKGNPYFIHYCTTAWKYEFLDYIDKYYI